jgi:hypothetical protein
MKIASLSLIVIPAQAGIQWLESWVVATIQRERHWIPACAGMTIGGVA